MTEIDVLTILMAAPLFVTLWVGAAVLVKIVITNWRKL
jgi:hypothetical protein